MLLGLKTDNPEAELYLYGPTGAVVAEEKWQADRELAHTLLGKIETFLRSHDSSLQGLKGIFVFEGPGSFTGLRIGITVANTLAYALEVPLVGTRGEAWRGEAVEKLVSGVNERVVMPFYGAEARITKPKK